MPFLRGDSDALEDIAEEYDLPEIADAPSNGAFEYEPAEAAFDAARLPPVARIVEAVVAFGASHFIVNYDGGHDEGFGHAHAFHVGGVERPAAEVAAELASPALARRIREAIAADGRHRYPLVPFDKMLDVNIVNVALDDLAGALASILLGEGFGTGEYQLYGAFTADLKTGNIDDHPDAPMPRDMGLE